MPESRSHNGCPDSAGQHFYCSSPSNALKVLTVTIVGTMYVFACLLLFLLSQEVIWHLRILPTLAVGRLVFCPEQCDLLIRRPPCVQTGEYYVLLTAAPCCELKSANPSATMERLSCGETRPGRECWKHTRYASGFTLSDIHYAGNHCATGFCA